MRLPLDPRSEPQWPGRLAEMCASLRRPDVARAETRTRAWVLLHDVMHASLRHESVRYRSVSREDIEDLASAKALDLLCRAERGEWDPSGRSQGEVVLYLRSTARHGLLRLLEQQGRVVPLDDPETAVPLEGRSAPASGSVPAPERAAEAREFTSGLVDCLSRVQPRARIVWCLRAVYELGSREIAAHPEVRSSPANVDMILMRTRAHLKACLSAKGFEAGPLPAGTVAMVWDRMAPHIPATSVVEHARGEDS